MMTEEYTITVQSRMRDIESIPEKYRKAVENELYIREKRRR